MYEFINLFKKNENILLLVAHPDDETIGFGGHISICKNLFIVHLTDGAPEDVQFAYRAGCKDRKDYANMRLKELHEVLDLCGFNHEHHYILDGIDQNVVFQLKSLIMNVVKIASKIIPTSIITHPYEGGHPDHDCAAFIAKMSVDILSKQTKFNAKVIEFSCYHEKNGSIKTSSFLNGDQESIWINLNEEQIDLKKRMFECYSSQKEMLSLFNKDRELFRIAPNYKFDQPPHEGTLLYEKMNWGVKGQQWRATVSNVACELKRI